MVKQENTSFFKRKKRMFITIFTILVLILVILNAISAYVGWGLTHPPRILSKISPTEYGLKYQDITFKSSYDDITLSGWLIPSQQKKSIVIMAHGYRGHRVYEKPIFPLAKELNRQNISVLAFDFRNSGTSGGASTTVGCLERYDLFSAIEFVKKEGYTHIGLAGFSMGAATSLLAASNPSVRAIMADSAFSDLKPYLESNLSTWSNLPNFPFTPLVLWQIPWLLDVSPELMRPIEEVKKNKETQIFFIHAKGDKEIPYQNSQQLFEATRKELAQLWITSANKHVGSYDKYKKIYLDKVTSFFKKNLS